MLDKLLKRVVRDGELLVVGHDGREYRYGSPDPGRAPVEVRLTDSRAAFDMARDPRLGAGEAYMNGRLIIERGDIAALVDLVRANSPWERGGLKTKGR